MLFMTVKYDPLDVFYRVAIICDRYETKERRSLHRIIEKFNFGDAHMDKYKLRS